MNALTRVVAVSPQRKRLVDEMNIRVGPLKRSATISATSAGSPGSWGAPKSATADDVSCCQIGRCELCVLAPTIRSVENITSGCKVKIQTLVREHEVAFGDVVALF